MQEFSIRSVSDSDHGNYTCRGQRRDSQSSDISDTVTLTVSERPRAVLSVSPQSWLTEGDSATLSYSSRGSGGSYTLSLAALNHTGVYACRGEREERPSYTNYSNLQLLWITGESPPVSLIINPSRTQHFTKDSLSLSCEDQSNSTEWTVRQYTHSKGVSNCSRWGSVTGSTCNISSLSTSRTGVYWCESESGENSNPVNITVHNGDVILESPVHPVTEGHPLTLRCLYRNKKPSNLRADFYKDGSVLQTQTTGEMIIQTVSKSDEGFYHCKRPERGESLKSWVSVRGSRFSIGTVGVAVGLSLAFLFSILLIFMILLWFWKINKGSANIYAIVDQADTSGTGEGAAESSEATYTQVTKNKKANRNNDVDAEPSGDDVTYAELEIKPKKKSMRKKEKNSVGTDTVYSELKLNMKN